MKNNEKKKILALKAKEVLFELCMLDINTIKN